MDKKTIILGSLLLFTFGLFAQAKDTSLKVVPNTYYYKRIYVGFNYGLAAPMGSFSTNNTEFNNSAFAKRGKFLNFFDFGYRVGKTLGFTGYLFNSSNQLDADAILSNLVEPDGINYFSAEAGDYQLRGMMLGLLVSKYGNLYDLDLKFMAGRAKFNVPHMAFGYTQDGFPGARITTYTPSSETTYGVGLGFGFRVHLNQNIDFTTNGNYLIFQNTFTKEIDDYSGYRVDEFRLTHETFNLSFGIAYRFLNDETVMYEH